MHNRIEWAKHSPQAYKAMIGLEQALANSGLETSLLELIRLRASQINGCAYCVNMHANDARKAGETEARLQTLSVWQETAYFTPRERAALAWVECLTRLPERGAPEADYQALHAHFEPAE
ncbi:carboxymuconolactone decarboxylase family protein, partial [Pseudomonas sp.]|uniref:carboxymuconolactone decarboxylase family protein n=2 Tax=Pseudomonas TaxID=286 RepID=UPI0039183ECD